MGIFNRRYFCFICFAFILTAFSLTFCKYSVIKLIVGAIAAICFVAFSVVFVKSKKYRFNALFSILVSLAVSVSAFSSYFVISRALDNASLLTGNQTVLLKIISPSDENEYDVRILRVGDKEVDVKGELYYKTNEEFEYGDRLIMNAYIYMSTDASDCSKLLSLSKLDDSEVYLNKAEIKNYFSYDGIMALCHSLQDKFSDHVDKTFGEYGALAKGLLVNDTRDIDAKTKTDFKRSGTSHILAVSGTHIALLMGAVELLLRKIEVKKEIRMVVIAVLSVFFLALTAFVASAVRSVLMLFAVYLCYILYEENDSLTSLFASVTIIILFSPFSVYDLGMWMSFLATLGILTVYPYFDERMPYPKQENLLVRYSLRLLVGIAKAFMLTLVANFFLLPVMWYFFGAVSISTIPCNIVLGPIVAVLMPLCALSTVLGFIPYVSAPFVFLTGKLFDAMMQIVRYFSEMQFGVVSLKYEFAGVLITIFAAAMAVILLVEFKHKLIIFAPMLAFVVAFVACFALFNYNAKPYIQCVRDNDSTVVFVNYGAECSVVDFGIDNAATSGNVLKYMSFYATEIDEYFIVNPDKNDEATLERVCKNTVIRKLYLPKNLENKDLSVYYAILRCAEKYNMVVGLYDYNSNVEICNSVSFIYTATDGALINSDKVCVKKQGSEIVCEYNDVAYDVGYEKGVSKIIPLN